MSKHTIGYDGLCAIVRGTVRHTKEDRKIGARVVVWNVR